MGHNIKKMHFWLFGGPWVADKDFLSYRENDEMSADADAA